MVSLRASPDYISLFSSLSLLQSAPTPDFTLPNGKTEERVVLDVPITTIPNVTLIGSKPSNVYVTLDATKGKTPEIKIITVRKPHPTDSQQTHQSKDLCGLIYVVKYSFYLLCFRNCGFKSY